MSDLQTERDAPTAGGVLRYVLAPDEALRLALPAYGRVRVGADVANDIVLRAGGVEAAHAYLHVDDYGIQIEALAQGVRLHRDGAWTDVALEQPVDLELGDRVAVGEAVLSFHTAEASSVRTRVWSHEALFVGARLREIFALVDRLAQTTAPVLVLGETGTGKNVVARRIHERSPRRAGPFVVANSQELDGGHHRDALEELLGRAAGGTLVLDEVSALPPLAQLGLGRFLERLESDSNAPDVRIVATTNRDLDVDRETHSFRLDLLFRLNRASVRLPALRDAPDDLPALARWLLDRLAPAPVALSEGALAALQRYRWPGNVRQLESALERALLVCDGDTLEAHHLPVEVRQGRSRDPSGSASNLTLKEEVAALEKRRIIEALEAHPSQAAAARALGMPLRTFVTRMDAYEIPRARSANKDEEE